MVFQILCIDNNEAVRSKNIDSLILAFQANDTIWGESISVHNYKIRYNSDTLCVEFSQFDTTKFVIGNRFIPAYIITVTSDDFNKIEPIRMKFIDHVKDMKFSHIRILHDDVSKNIACKMYPLFYEIENKLREFITNTLVKKIGADFWQFVVPKETIDTANKYKTNEPFFIGADKVVGDVMLLYFDALGKIVYGDLPVFTQPKDILERVKIASSLEDLKSELLDGNFQKYFKDCFEKSDFRNKWTRLNTLRNKVAHNSYFLNEEYIDCKKLTDELNYIIDEAYKRVDTLKLSVVDMEALKKAIDESVNIDTNETQPEKSSATNDSSLSIEVMHNDKDVRFKIIDEDTLLKKLSEVSNIMPFVGLKHFVRDILGEEGYSFNSSYALINILIDRGMLMTEKVENPIGEYDTTSIKVINK